MASSDRLNVYKGFFLDFVLHDGSGDNFKIEI